MTQKYRAAATNFTWTGAPMILDFFLIQNLCNPYYCDSWLDTTEIIKMLNVKATRFAFSRLVGQIWL